MNNNMKPFYLTYESMPIKLKDLKPGDMFMLSNELKCTNDAEIYIVMGYKYHAYIQVAAVTITGENPGEMHLITDDTDIFVIKDFGLDNVERLELDYGHNM